jgi:hypothetical protein
MKKSEVEGELMRIIDQVRKHQRINKFAATWQVLAAMRTVDKKITDELFNDYYQ